jgi:hypothetical protein
MARPRLSSIRWAEYERRCLIVLRAALTLLSEQTTGPGENDINRDLYSCIRSAHAASRDGATLSPVVYECMNPPSPRDKKRAAREFKRPDFQWGLMDDQAEPEDAYKYFVIECKRLAPSARGQRRYAKLYISDGILRFVSPGHGYGKDAESGAMVGYLQSLSVDDALVDVNANAAKRKLPALELSRRDGDRAADLEHRLKRNFPVTSYRLSHLWVRVSDQAPPAATGSTDTPPPRPRSRRSPPAPNPRRRPPRRRP